MIWFVLLMTTVAFALGFAFSWVRVKRRLQAKVDAQVEAEIRRQIQQRVLDELSSGRMRNHITAATGEVTGKPAQAEVKHD